MMKKIIISSAMLSVAALSLILFLNSKYPDSISNNPEAEYVVDANDFVNGESLVNGIAKSELSESEIHGLIQMREEEKLARDVYTTLGETWGINVFTNISGSEQTHTNAIKTLLDRYSIADPVTNNEPGVFQSPAMQKLYNDLVTKGKTSLTEALIVGATIEDLDIHDLDVFIKDTNNEDILITYNNLQKGSRNHLRAFNRQIEKSGNSYSPQYISKASFEAIVGAEQERGRR